MCTAVRYVSMLGVAILCFVNSFTVFAGTSSPNVVLLWPDTATTPVNPRLIYQCADTTCSDMTQATQVGYVTAVPVQSQYGVVSPAPAPVTFIDPVVGATTFTVYLSDTATVSPSSTWTSCTLGVDANGGLDAANTTCLGAVLTENATATASTFAVGAGTFTVKPDTPPQTYQAYNAVPDRTITFKNSTSYNICLNLASQFNTTACTGTGDNLINSGASYVLQVSGSTGGGEGGGAMSQAAFVTGYSDGGDWVYTGNDASLGGVYATAVEWSLFPTAPVGASTLPANTTDHSLGMSDIDVSVVNGYNFGVTLSAASGTVCSSATRQDGNAEPASYALYPGVISQFPVDDSQFESMCPSTPVFNADSATQVVTDPGTQDFIGCLSPCKYATEVQSSVGLTDDQVNAICCQGSTYGDSVACTNAQIPWGNTSSASSQFAMITHDQLPYVTNIKGNSTNVYTWQFDDDNGNFSCDPDASFVFEITTR